MQGSRCIRGAGPSLVEGSKNLYPALYGEASLKPMGRVKGHTSRLSCMNLASRPVLHTDMLLL